MVFPYICPYRFISSKEIWAPFQHQSVKIITILSVLICEKVSVSKAFYNLELFDSQNLNTIFYRFRWLRLLISHKKQPCQGSCQKKNYNTKSFLHHAARKWMFFSFGIIYPFLLIRHHNVKKRQRRSLAASLSTIPNNYLIPIQYSSTFITYIALKVLWSILFTSNSLSGLRQLSTTKILFSEFTISCPIVQPVL